MSLTEIQRQFLIAAVAQAKAAGHIFPEMAACEAAVESAWGSSELAHNYNNLFGQKQQTHPVYGTVHIPTKEFIAGKWVDQDAAWVVFPDWQFCFASRMNTLRNLSTTYPHYALALASDTPEEYVTEVSKSWSTSPTRAETCIEIFNAHKDILDAALAS